jgi:hypothetical protein
LLPDCSRNFFTVVQSPRVIPEASAIPGDAAARSRRNIRGAIVVVEDDAERELKFD